MVQRFFRQSSDKEANNWLVIFMALLISFRIMTYFQKETLTFHFKKSNSLIKDFLQKTKVRELTYMPHFLALNGHIQAFIYCWIELLQVKLR